MTRPVRLTWVGEIRYDGLPVAHLGPYGIAPSDLDEDATKALSDEQIALALSSGLYVADEPPAKDAKSTKAAKVAAASGAETPDDSGDHSTHKEA